MQPLDDIIDAVGAVTRYEHKAIELVGSVILQRIEYYPRAREATKLATSDLAKILRLVDIASHVGMSPSCFSRFFAQKIGISFFSLVKKLRIQYALDLLVRRDLPIKDLAELTGYADAAAFSRAFRIEVGVSPTEFRRRVLSYTHSP